MRGTPNTSGGAHHGCRLGKCFCLQTRPMCAPGGMTPAMFAPLRVSTSKTAAHIQHSAATPRLPEPCDTGQGCRPAALSDTVSVVQSPCSAQLSTDMSETQHQTSPPCLQRTKRASKRLHTRSRRANARRSQSAGSRAHAYPAQASAVPDDPTAAAAIQPQGAHCW